MLSAWNTEQTVPSTKNNNFLDDKVVVTCEGKKYNIDVYDTPLAKRWIQALGDNLQKQRVLEKNFCWLGWADSKRDLRYLVKQLNQSVEQINSFTFEPPYERIHPFSQDDFQFSNLKLKHESCNLLHRYFEELQGTAWKLSDYYKQADNATKYAIRQLNNICHEIESWVLSYRKSQTEPEWIRPAQITTFLNAPRYDLQDQDYELFKENRYRRELGGVYLHWCQVGKTLYEVYRDENAPIMTEAMCSEINHQKYYSGEFDVEWGQTIDENFEWRQTEMSGFRKWLKENDYDWEDPKLSLGYIKIGQINLKEAFGDKTFIEIYNEMKKNLNITTIEIIGNKSILGNYPYGLDDQDWKQKQIESLKRGYESHSLR